MFLYGTFFVLNRLPLTLEDSLQRLGVEVRLVDTTPSAADDRIRDEMDELLKTIRLFRSVKGGRPGRVGEGFGE